VNKNESSLAVADRTGFSKGDAANSRRWVCSEAITHALKQGGDVRLVRLRYLQRRQSQGLAGRNRATGEPLSIAATKQRSFGAAGAEGRRQLTIGSPPFTNPAGRPQCGRCVFG